MINLCKSLIVSFIFLQALNADDKPKMNIVLISVDDLNDWIGVLGGHPQAKTPGMDYLASKGMLFSNAQCQSPVCNPSRASLMSSLYPSTSGVYFLSPDLKESPVSQKNILLPKRFQNEGFAVTGVGKLFHGPQSKAYWPNWQSYGGASYPRQKPKLSAFPGHPLWDWGIVKEADETMPDYKAATWAEKALKKTYKKPFLIGVGFSRPHVPQYATKKWFDLYPMDTLKLPAYLEHDLNDVPQYGADIISLKHVAPTHEWVTENKQWKPLVRSYLACVSFVDAQVERVVKAVENSQYKDNTYIVLFSDHGFHIGEKNHHAKRTLWEDGTRVPMIIMGPGIKPGVCRKPVQLLDLYPTLLALTGLKADKKLEGNDLRPLLKKPQAAWSHYARTCFGPGNYAITSERYRYITYNDGREEFYDRQKDPNEWQNQIKNPEYASLVKAHKADVPKQRYKVLGKGSTGHKAFAAAEEKIKK
jgi:arylsulfatase A-like enzyme